jgi:lethal(2) giant larvae protein
MKTKQTFIPSGLVVTSFVQLYPPAAVSALALCSDIQMYICLKIFSFFSISFILFLFSYAAGTAHGFTIFNYKQNRILAAKCTLDPNALGNTPIVPLSTGESTLIRGRSLKKSLRESFRRLRKGRTIKKATMLPIPKRTDENNPLSPVNLHLEEVIRVPVERQVEFREFKPIDDQVASMVRCLYFAKTYLNSGKYIKFKRKYFSL